ncbi:accessory gene regulator B family protein [Clostridioides difficile]
MILEICSYGLEILLSSIINTLSSLMIGLILGRLIYSIVFLICFYNKTIFRWISCK